MGDEENDHYCTRDTSLPAPSRTVQIATEYLAKVVTDDMGVKNGQTALYWDLIHTVCKHAGKRI